MSDQLGISVGATGLTVTVPGVIAAFASICLPLTVGRLDRRVLLAALLAVMAIGSVVSALAPTFTILIVSRVLVGITIGGFWAIAGCIPVRLVPGPSVPRALTLVFVGVAATALLVAGHYAAYTFVSPVLLDISGVSSAITGLLLLGYGVVGMAGNVIAGSWASRAAGRTMTAIVIVLGAALVLFPLLGVTPWTGAALLLVWGPAYGAAPVALQTWVLNAGSRQRGGGHGGWSFPVTSG